MVLDIYEKKNTSRNFKHKRKKMIMIYVIYMFVILDQFFNMYFKSLYSNNDFLWI